MSLTERYEVDVFSDPDINNYWRNELWVPKVIVVSGEPKDETEVRWVAKFERDKFEDKYMDWMGSNVTHYNAYRNLVNVCECAGILVSDRLYKLIRDSQCVSLRQRMRKWELMRIIVAYNNAFGLSLMNLLSQQSVRVGSAGLVH
jgi:hypothetical protein